MKLNVGYSLSRRFHESESWEGVLKPRKLTLIRIAAHDFRRSLRVWTQHLEPQTIFERLVQERHRANVGLLRTATLALIAMLWLGANKDELVLKISFLDLAIPAAYVNAAVALFVLGVVMNFITYITLNEFVRVASNKLFKFDAPWALSVIYDGSDAWSIGNIGQFRFFDSSKTHRRVAYLYLSVLNLPMLILLISGYVIVLTNGWNVLVRQGLFTMSGVVTVAAWILLMQAALMVAVMFVQFTFTKDTQFIRWLFLNKIYRRMGVWHPRADTWAAKQEDGKEASLPKRSSSRLKVVARSTTNGAD